MGDRPVAVDDRTEASPGREPKYWGLKLHLLALIEGLPAGAPLPQERQLAREFAVSRTTVRQALHEMVVEGRLRRVRGRGTFKTEPKVAQALQLTSYTEDMIAARRRPASKLLEVTKARADAGLAERLWLRAGEEVLRVRRLRLADNQPMAIELTHLPHQRFPGLRRLLEDGGSLYTSLREQYGVHPAEAEETIETALTSPEEAALLATDAGLPMLLLTRHSFDTDGRPFEFVRSVYRGDRYKFVARLTRPPTARR